MAHGSRLRLLLPALPGERIARLREALGRALGLEVGVVGRYGELADALVSGQAELAWAPPMTGARIEAQGGRTLVRATRRGASSFRSAVVCRRDRPVDLANPPELHAAWVDRESSSGYLLPRVWLRGLGLSPDRFFAAERFSGSHRAVLRDVLEGRADLGAVYASSDSAERPYSALDELSEAERACFQIIAFTDEAPNDGIVAGPHVDEATVQAARRRWLEATGDAGLGDAELRAALSEAFNVDGFEAAPAQAYLDLHRLVLATFGLAPLPSRCAVCATEASPKARFCEQCGAPVRRPSLPPPASLAAEGASGLPPPASPISSISGAPRPSSVERSTLVVPAPPRSPSISGSPRSTPPSSRGAGAWLEERKLATILFADISGFTALSSRLEPEALREMANECFEPLSEEIARHGGTVLKFIGDCVMAVFGAPIAREDDPKRAVRAALGMMSILGGLAERFEESCNAKIAMRIGINTGWLMVGHVGGATHGAMDVMGWTVNLASRIEGASKPGQVMVGPATYRQLGDEFEVEPLPPVALKGVPEPLPLYRVVGERARGGASPRDADGPFFRGAELDRLVQALTDVTRSGRARVVRVVGDAGLGKGRLVERFCERARQEGGIELLRTSGAPGGTADMTPLGLFGRLLGERFRRTDPDESPEAASERAISGFASAWGPLERDVGLEVASALAQLGRPQGLDGSVPLSARELPRSTDRLLSALSRWLCKLAESAAVCVVLEDLHWADDRSLDLVERLAESVAEAPLLLLLTARPEVALRQPGWSAAREGYERLDLAPLAAREMEELFAHLLAGAGDLPASLRDELVARAEGNPEFARELVRLLADRGALVPGDDGRAPGAQEPGALALPETVQGVLQARLDALPVGEKEVLRAASVVGRTFWRGALEATGAASAGKAPGAPYETALAALEAKGLVREAPRSAIPGERQYLFQSAGLRDLAYQSLPRPARAVAHRAVARWLEQRRDPSVAGDAEIAGHLDAGGDADGARVHFVRAARHAMGVLAFDEAVGFYRRALALAHPGVPRGERAEAHRELALALGRTGRLEEALGALGEAEALAREAGATAISAWVELERARLLHDHGRNDDALLALDRGLDLARDEPVGVLHVQLHAARAFLRAQSNDPEGARSDAERGLAIGEAAGSVEAVWMLSMARLHNALGAIRLYHSADLAGAEESFGRALECKRRAGDREGELDGLINLGAVAFERGDLDAAGAHFAEGLRLSRRAKWVKYVATCASNLGQTLVAKGRPEESLPLLEEAERLAEEAGLVGAVANSAEALARARLASGQPQAALEDALRAMRHAERSEVARFRVAAHDAAMRCLLAGAEPPGGGPPLEAARAHLREAAAILRASGSPKAEEEIAALEAALEAARPAAS